MSLVDRMIRSAARPKSFWAMLAVCALAPVLAFPYILLVNGGVISHSVYGFVFFLGMIFSGFCLLLYYQAGMLSGRYNDLEGRAWSELPW
jgi:uncharacterized RDD family membrane protein YckC